MISDRQEKEREIRKEQILKAALKVFKLQGIEKSTMDEIAKQADFGKASLYYYFSSKEEIFVELLDRGWKMIWESIEPVIHNRDHPKDTFINALNIIGGLVRNDSVLFEFLFTAPKTLSENPNEKNIEWKKYQSKMYSVLQSLLEEGIEKKEFPRMRPDILMRAIGGLFHGLFFLGNEKKSMSRETMEEFITTFIGNYGTS
ncbi:MAG: TetR/AcrR family transcriptional regulator [Candidatus Neomarinimicrobiota bacterium]|nr:TetR/AcrR family transcriptional regulator [Candidatus Neomarinimicrobiota bacterium]MEC9436797.1 TetR/AcrR family transcriptional regulator [Candidatus Neomarinimicrobiota bacterium]MEC9474985.1 TetR/AcrR family transcriptional regulator [Candidatus Neomarinimicrobiota bacterium]MED5248577.1 TetR/AcrR family transcriptional regulator [Candidatus Neomarinimicrobiota bacterium]MED5434245.1 TetR/AcrR family transcriptional regulator [Candidatus Neomarinimicrobiota bacterium]